MYYILIFIKTPHDFVCCSAELVLFTHCQKRDFGAKNRSVLSKILIGFSENPLELGKIGGDSWTQIFTAFSMQRGAESLENTAFSGLSHLPLSSVKFCQVRFWQLDSKCGRSAQTDARVRISPSPPPKKPVIKPITGFFLMPLSKSK